MRIAHSIRKCSINNFGKYSYLSMLKCVIGDNYAYYINKYANNRVFYAQEWNISQEAFIFV